MNERKKGAILSYVLLFVNNIVALLYTPVLIRYLGQSEYGLYSLINSIIGYLTILDLGFGNAIIIYTTKYRLKENKKDLEKLHSMFFLIYLVIALIVVSLGIILYFNASNLFANTMTKIELETAKQLLLILTINLGLTFSFNIYPSIITAYEKFTYQKVLSIIKSLLNPLIMLPLLMLGYKSVALVIVTTILNILILISNYLYCKKKLEIKIKIGKFDTKIFKEIFIYSIFIFINIIVDKINFSLDQFILGSICGTIAVSIYAIASQINMMYMNISTSISSVLVPKITKMIENKVDINDEIVKIGRIQFLILLLIVTGFALFGKVFITIWAGQNYIDAYYIALILMIPLIIPLSQNIIITILQVKKLHKFRSLILFLISIINILISIPLAKNYKAIGASVGTSLSLIIGNIIIMNIYYYKKVKLNILIYFKNILTITIKNSILFIITLLILKFINISNLLSLIISILIYTLVYIIYNYLTVLNNYEKNILKKMTRKMSNL